MNHGGNPSTRPTALVRMTFLRMGVPVTIGDDGEQMLDHQRNVNSICLYVKVTGDGI